MDVTRVDVFSLKGGVGKTTIAYLLACMQAKVSKKPVLVIDADLTGTCIGDLVMSKAEWAEKRNLAHLLCRASERLPDTLETDLPVYHEPSAEPLTQPFAKFDAKKHFLDKLDERFALLCCPSHAYAHAPAPSGSGSGADDLEITDSDRQVLSALVGHENSGSWVRDVIQKVVNATIKIAGELGGVVVDHGPGMAAMQTALFWENLETSLGKAMLVVSTDRVDLRMVHAFLASINGEIEKRYANKSEQDEKKEKIVKVVSCVQAPAPASSWWTERKWRETVHSRTDGTLPSPMYPWLERDALAFAHSEELEAAYRNSGQGKGIWSFVNDPVVKGPLGAIRQKVFG